MSARFVKLTCAGYPSDPDEPVWVRADSINNIGTHAGHTLINGCSVRETPEQILALLAEPAPSPSVEVTEAAVEAALVQFWRGTDGTFRGYMRAAIEAADRARGLRP